MGVWHENDVRRCSIGYLDNGEGSKPAVVHQNIFVEKILIDQQLNPLIMDSGLPKLLADDVIYSALKTSAAMGYMAPKYITTSRFTEKSDVFAYGVIIFQILLGKRLLSSSMRSAAECCGFENFIDSNLKGNFTEPEAAILGKIALCCTSELPDNRPTIFRVIEELNDCQRTERKEDEEKQKDSEKTRSGTPVDGKEKEHHLEAEAEKEQEEDFPSPPVATETGGARAEIADIEASSPSLGDRIANVPSHLNTPGIDLAGPSAQTEPTADFQRLLELLLELKAQQYGMEFEIKNLQSALKSTSDSLHKQVQALKLQVQETAKGEDSEKLKEIMRKLKETVQSLGDFQLVRIPKRP
ncbi:calcium/calmodulin-regulated receptor-like kinase 1 [Eucalyptus grandis]|uniref:calcium/calmodulin-regulated receptor-like kinase 1 n=1 Tax=Eucalyptus grandis TaxID=71139 RepID=UPI0008A0C951|nr:calcium/calmodulin-regulated receptor-like kinase 1 [Eucalyptus grandis]